MRSAAPFGGFWRQKAAYTTLNPARSSASRLSYGKGMTGAGAAVCASSSFSIHTMSYQRPNL